MDNGLIFPYRRRTAHTNPVMLTIRTVTSFPSGDTVAGSMGPGLVR